MKKIPFLVFYFSLFHFVASAQELPDGTLAPDSLKATKRSFTTELNVNPFKGELSLNNSLNQVKFRFFPSSRSALRMGLMASTLRDNIDNSSPYGTNPTKHVEVRKSTTLGLNLGFEKHLAGTKRLSPYLGAEAAFEIKTSSNEITTLNSVTQIDGAWREVFVT